VYKGVRQERTPVRNLIHLFILWIGKYLLLLFFVRGKFCSLLTLVVDWKIQQKLPFLAAATVL